MEKQKHNEREYFGLIINRKVKYQKKDERKKVKKDKRWMNMGKGVGES